MEEIGFDLIYNLQKIKTDKDENINIEEEEYNNDNHICNYEYDNDMGHYICSICGEVNYEMNKVLDINDMNDTKPTNNIINNSDVVKTKGIKNYQLSQKASRIYSNMDYEKKELLKMMTEINNYCQLLNLQKNIIDDVQLIYKNVVLTIKNDKKNKFSKGRGRNNEGLIGACIYYGCLKNDICIPIQKISKCMNNLKQRYIHDECSMILKLIESYPSLKTFIPITCFYFPVNYLKTMIRCFNITKQTDINNLKKMLIYIQYDQLIPNHTLLTISLAVSLVYLVYKGLIKPNFAKKDVATYFGITQPTVSKSYNELQAKKSIILNYCLNHTEEDILNKFNKVNGKLNDEIVNKLKKTFINLKKDYITQDIKIINKLD